MRLIFSAHAWEDYLYWQNHDRRALRRVNELIRGIQRSPHDGVGKPEPLKHALAGYRSRRIDDEHRLVYTVRDGDVLIVQARYHY